jgi:hypothetical protein
MKINENPDSINFNGEIECLEMWSKHLHCCPAVRHLHKMTAMYFRPEALNTSFAKTGQYTEPVYCID